MLLKLKQEEIRTGLAYCVLKSLNYYFRQNAHTQTHHPLHTSIGPWQFSWRFVPNIYTLHKKYTIALHSCSKKQNDRTILNNNNKNTAKDSHSIKYSLMF